MPEVGEVKHLCGGELRRGVNNGRWKGGKVERSCLECGKVFFVKPSRFKSGRGKFCSKSCGVKNKTGELHRRWQGKDIEKFCLNCGETFKVRPRKHEQQFCSLSCHMIFQRKSGVFNISPNIPEKELIAIFERLNLPFRYVGGGEVWLGNRNPDFINANGKKQIIELFGVYWHSLFDEAQRKEHYKQYGFNCLVIWEDELAALSKVQRKIKRFTREG